MKRLLVFAASFLLAALAFAAARPPYRIELRNGTHVLSKDRPVHRGSVLLFHIYPTGVLTGLPGEEVLAVTSGGRAADQVTVTSGSTSSFPQMLAPGAVVVLGPTAGDRVPSASGSTAAAPSAGPAIPGGVYDPRNPAFGYSPPRNANIGAGNLPTGVMTGDLARAVSAPPPTAEPSVGPNGFPVTPGSATLSIGPDGQPILAPPGVTGSTPPAIGPDGMPVLAPPGAPGSTPPAIGPNGTPILAPPGAPGSTPPVIGPNGTPILAPPGSPGSSPPPVGPNGYPATGPKG